MGVRELRPIPALEVLVMLAFVPFIWGLRLLSAAAMLTFRRGGGAVIVGATVLGLLSGAYLPLDLLPAASLAAGVVAFRLGPLGMY